VTTTIKINEDTGQLDPVPPERHAGAGEAASALGLVLLVTQNLRWLGSLTLAVTVLTAIIVFLLPKMYTANSQIMPPQQSQTSAALMLGQLGGPLAAVAGRDLMKNPNDMYVGMLKSRTVLDGVIKRHNLQTVYGKATMIDTRSKLLDRTEIRSGKDGIISIDVEDRDPRRAADLANSYIDELATVTSTLAITDAARRRHFFEKQLASTKESLMVAESRLREQQEVSGVIEPLSQARVMIESAALMRAEIAAKEVQLASMESFGTAQNPDIVRLKREIAGLNAQLRKLETSEKTRVGDIQLSSQKAPTAGLEYVRRLREVKYFEAVYELLAKQLEAARLDEAKDAPSIQVLDRAVVPERKSWPPRILIILLSAFVTLLLCLVALLLRQAWRMMVSEPLVLQQLGYIRASFQRR
jgi:tyrosine-protein kinase Etk/Wzc